MRILFNDIYYIALLTKLVNEMMPYVLMYNVLKKRKYKNQKLTFIHINVKGELICYRLLDANMTLNAMTPNKRPKISMRHMLKKRRIDTKNNDNKS